MASKTPSICIIDIFNKTSIPIPNDGAREFAEEFIQTLKDRIRSNDFDIENSIEYNKQKAKEGFGTIPLIRTGQYLDSITMEETKYGFIIGVRDAKHYGDPTKTGEPPKEIRMIDLARYLEFGLPGRMEAKSHWRSVMMSMLRKSKNFKPDRIKTKQGQKQEEMAMKKREKFNEFETKFWKKKKSKDYEQKQQEKKDKFFDEFYSRKLKKNSE